MQDVMLDIETMGNSPRAVMLSIGAVFFGNGELGEEFYVRVDADSCVRAGLVMDVDTVMWWMRQGEEARASLASEGYPLKEALDTFAWFIGARGLGGVADHVRVWGNGAAFDNVILGSGYRALRAPQPWKFWNDRCYRTVKELNRHVPLEKEKRVGVHHHALDDAKSQALHLMEIFRDSPNVETFSRGVPYYPQPKFWHRLRWIFTGR